MRQIQKFIDVDADDCTIKGRIYVPNRDEWMLFSMRHGTGDSNIRHTMSLRGGLMPNFLIPLLGTVGYNTNNIIRFLKEGKIDVTPIGEGNRISIRSGDFLKMVDYLNVKWTEKHGIATNLAGHVQLEFE